MTLNLNEPLTPKVVALRLNEMIESIKSNSPIDVSEEEIRAMQRFFNELSVGFLRQATAKMKLLENSKRYKKRSFETMMKEIKA